MEFHLVQNRKENYHQDHIPFNAKGNGNIVFSVQGKWLPSNIISLYFRRITISTVYNNSTKKNSVKNDVSSLYYIVKYRIV